MAYRLVTRLLLCGSMLAALAMSGWLSFHIATWPHTIKYGEASLLDQSRRVTAGESLYKTHPERPPYIIANYPPVYPLLLAAVQRLSGLSWLAAGRLISVTAAILAAGFIAAIVFPLSGNRSAAALAAALFLGHPFVALWSSLARVDALALFWAMLGLWLAQRRPLTERRLFGASVALLLAVATRQTYLLAAPLAIFVLLWRVRGQIAAIVWALLFGTAVLAVAGVINLCTGGAFLFHVIRGNVNAMAWTDLMAHFLDFVRVWPMVGHLFAWSIVYRHQLPPWLVALLIGSFGSALTVGKTGSDINYFFELIAALSLAAGLLARIVPRGVVQLVMAMQLLWAVMIGYLNYRPLVDGCQKALPELNALYDRIDTAASQGTVLSDDYMGMIVQAGQPVYYQPFEYGQLYVAGLWDPAELVADISAGRFALVVIGGPSPDKPCCWPPEVVAALRKHYRLVAADAWATVFEPTVSGSNSSGAAMRASGYSERRRRKE